MYRMLPIAFLMFHNVFFLCYNCLFFMFFV